MTANTQGEAIRYAVKKQRGLYLESDTRCLRTSLEQHRDIDVIYDQ